MRYSERRDLQALFIEHGRGLCFHHIDDTDIETHAVALRGAQRGAHHLKRAILLVEQAHKECRKIGRHVISGRTCHAPASRGTDDG